MGRRAEQLKRPIVAAIECIQGVKTYRALAARLRPAIHIVEATDADLRAIHAWFNPGEPDHPQGRAPGVTNYAAKHGDKIVGFVQMVRRSEDAGPHAGFWLYSLRVRLTYRGMGLGEDLCNQVIETARAEGAPELSLVVNADNDAAIGLYSKLGFTRKPVPELDAQFERDRAAMRHLRMVMSKHLTQSQGAC